MKTSAKVFLSVLALGLSFGFSTSYASGDTFVPPANSYIPHVYLFGFAGSSITTRGDILQPIFLRSDKNLFAYGQGNYGYADEDWAKNSWTGSFALGYRQIVSNAAVLGAYVFGDYTRTTTDHSVWLVSPGIEALGRAWEFHANGYFPVSKKDWVNTDWASEFGNYDYIRFSGHDQFDAMFRFHEETGPGVDAELGRTLFKVHNALITGFINGYYFHMRDNTDVRGGGAAITVRPNTYLELSVNGSYDNYAHTVVMLGIQLSLYDLFSNASKVLNEQDLQRRLFDPIHRNFVDLASGSDVRMTGGPRDEETRKAEEPEVIEPEVPEKENIWFFKENGGAVPQAANAEATVGDGTYENPFTGPDFNQQTVNDIYTNTILNGFFPQAFLYFTGGPYFTLDAAGISARLNLPSNESMWGRMGGLKGFQMPATGANRPNFIGGLKLDSSTSVNNLTLQNNAAQDFVTGILLDGATNVSINDSDIGVDGPTDSYVTGVTMKNNSDLTISGSNIYGFNVATGNPFSPNTFAVGLEVQNGGNVTAINGSLIQGHSTNSIGVGLYVAPTTDGSGNIESKMGNISGDKTATFKGESDNVQGYGFFALSNNVGSGSARVEIGNIADTRFDGDVVGFLVLSFTGAGAASIATGNISDSVFTGVQDGLNAVSSSTGPTTTIFLGAVTNNTFTGGSRGLDLSGLTVKVNTVTYTTGAALLADLGGNTFNAPVGLAVCVNSSCA